MENNKKENSGFAYTPSKTAEKNYAVSTSSPSSSESSIQLTVLKKKCFSSYEKKVAKKTEEKQAEPLLGLESHSQSSVESSNSGLQDGSTHQIKSVQSTDRLSDLVSHKSNCTNNSSFISPSKRNRPVSAPPGQLRCVPFPSSKCHLAQKTLDVPATKKVPPIFKRQPCILRVTAYENGTRSVFAKVAVPPSMKLLLEECTAKLKLNRAARRVFLADGTEALDAGDIPHDADIYISTGEPFSNPLTKIKDHLLLMKNANWTLNGLVLPSSVKQRKVKLVLSEHIQKLMEKPTIRMLVFKNGMGQHGREIAAPLDQMEKVLDNCTKRLNLNSPAKYMYNMHGEKVQDLINIPLLEKCLQNSATPLRGPLWVSKGEGFSPSGAKMYFKGVLLALHQQLKTAKNYCEQLNYAMDGQNEKLTDKSILSMKKEERLLEQEEVNKRIDELQAAIKSYKGHLSKLAPQLQAEQEQCTSYVYQHIKELPANTLLSQGLQLKVYENGKDTGGILVYINKKELENHLGRHPNTVLERVQHLIHERLQHSSDFKPSGLNHFPTRLFDETGQEIKNPHLLQNEQKIWVSYGEAYRSPLNPVLGLTFDRVTAATKDGITVIYKTLLDPTADMLPGCDNWEICAGFPCNFQLTNHLELHSLETVNANHHFIQYKANPQIVILVSVTMENMRKAIPRRKDQQDLMSVTAPWPLSNMWLITKDFNDIPGGYGSMWAGMILSRAIAQSCLAVGQPFSVATQNGLSLEGYKLHLEKRDKNSIYQYWQFGNDGSIHSKACPEFVLTYLDELNVGDVVTQTEHHTHHGIQSPIHKEADSNSTEEFPVPNQGQVLHEKVSNCREQQLSDAHLMPEGPLEENDRQLTVALVRKLEEKHPKASSQRWAIKHEGTSKPGQWKQSKVDNPLWNKLTYMWPVLPNGELNEAFDWPIEGLLIPNSPPLKKPAGMNSYSHMPMKLRVLRNGEQDQNKAISILVPDYTTMKKQNCPENKHKAKKLLKMYPDVNSEKEIHRTEFQHFLERCTMVMNLPFAARRLFTGQGIELFLLKDLERDQLIYISCGEQWIDPLLAMAHHKKRLQLSNLASDITAIRAYCAMRNPKNFVLAVKNDIVVGAKLFAEKEIVDFEGKEVVEEPEEKQAEESTEKIKVEADKCLTSHAKSHLKADASYAAFKYMWQLNSYEFDEDYSFQKEKDEQFFENTELYQKYRHHLKLTEKSLKVHQQKFEFRNGQIVNCRFPNLVLGVANSDLHSGTEVVLMEKKCDNIHQHWIWREASRTFHLVSNPDLVLSVSMPMPNILHGYIPLEMQGFAVVVQKYNKCQNGSANQKWNYIEATKGYRAFYSTVLDQEITAANCASLCTFSVSNAEKIDQPGYYFLSPDGKHKIMICLACARNIRGKKELRKLLPGTLFICASGFEEGNQFCTWPFKCLSVKKTDLSTSEAETTLRYLDDVLASLRTEALLQTISEKTFAAVSQKAVKIIAYRNGAGYQNGQLITASTFPMLLTLCATRLELKRMACRLYSREGTLILTLQDLVLWAVNNFYKNQEDKDDGATFVCGPEETASALPVQDKLEEETNAKSASSVMPPDNAKLIDNSVLTIILRNPIEVWVSSGEPFLPLETLQNAERRERQDWLEKDKILADLDAMKHKMRQLQGRRITKYEAPSLVPTKSPFQPVVVEGGWTEETQEEMELTENIQHREMHLSEIQALQFKRRSPFFSQLLVKHHRSLYNQPTTKRVWVYVNGCQPKQGAHAWGKTIAELLESSTTQLKMPQPAKALYTTDGERLQSWDEIERDMVLCVSTGNSFLNRQAVKHEVEIRALYSRIRKHQGPEATNIIISPSVKVIEQVNMNTPLLALPCRNPQHSNDMEGENACSILEYSQKNEESSADFN